MKNKDSVSPCLPQQKKTHIQPLLLSITPYVAVAKISKWMRVQEFGAGKAKKCCFKSLGLHSLRWVENLDYLPELKKALSSFIKGASGDKLIQSQLLLNLFSCVRATLSIQFIKFCSQWTENEEFQLELAAAGSSSEEIFCKHPFAHKGHPLPSDCSVATPSILFGGNIIML